LFRLFCGNRILGDAAERYSIWLQAGAGSRRKFGGFVAKTGQFQKPKTRLNLEPPSGVEVIPELRNIRSTAVGDDFGGLSGIIPAIFPVPR
jgi:hypothetical protein